MKEKRWVQASEGERIFWHELKGRASSEAYQLAVKQYWAEILAQLPFSINDSSRILDVGCGPLGILWAIDKGERYGLDPLILDYMQDFRMPPDIHWIPEKIEDFSPEIQYDIIFAMNSLDHIDDFQRGVKKLKSLLARDGYLVVMIYCHTTFFFKYYFRSLNRYIDKWHPHHLSAKEVVRHFSDLCLCHHMIVSDHSANLLETAELPRKDKRLGHLMRALIKHPAYFVELETPVKIAAKFGLPRYGSGATPRGIFKLNLFVFHQD